MKADLRGKSIAVYRMGKYFINDVLGRGLICPPKVFDNEKTNNPIKMVHIIISLGYTHRLITSPIIVIREAPFAKWWKQLHRSSQTFG